MRAITAMAVAKEVQYPCRSSNRNQETKSRPAGGTFCARVYG